MKKKDQEAKAKDRTVAGGPKSTPDGSQRWSRDAGGGLRPRDDKQSGGKVKSSRRIGSFTNEDGPSAARCPGDATQMESRSGRSSRVSRVRALHARIPSGSDSDGEFKFGRKCGPTLHYSTAPEKSPPHTPLLKPALDALDLQHLRFYPD